MITPNEVTTYVQAAVTEYFEGERREELLIVSGSVLLTALAMWLWASTRSGFALAFFATVLFSGLLVGGVAGSLLLRDKGIASELLQGLDSPKHAQVMNAEYERVGAIISKYRYYRYGAAILAALSVLGLTLSSRGWVHGVAAGLLLVVVAQVIIDNYSERRARLYFERLSPNAAAWAHK